MRGVGVGVRAGPPVLVVDPSTACRLELDYASSTTTWGLTSSVIGVRVAIGSVWVVISAMLVHGNTNLLTI